MRKWFLVMGLVLIIGVVLFTLGKIGLVKTMSSEQLKASIEIEDMDTMWVAKDYQTWPPKLTLVPAISFKVKNLTDDPLHYINFNANFRFRDDLQNLGDSFMAAIRNEPIPPHGMSEPIILKSNYGVEGQSLASFKDNPHWKVVVCKLFASSKGSQYALIGEYEISKRIDFKEDEDVGLAPKEKAEPDKRP